MPKTSFAEPKEPRFRAWAASLVFTSICIASHASTLGNRKSRADKWVLSALSLNLIASFLGVLGHFLIRDKFINEVPEGGVAAFMSAFWIFSLPAIMDPSKEIALTGRLIAPTVINSNLYFFSWITFGISLYILGHFVQTKSDLSAVGNISQKASRWAALFACSIVVVASASQFHKDASCGGFFKGEEFCSRGSYAIAMGVISMVASMAVVGLSIKGVRALTPMVEFGVATVLFIFYIFGVAFLTFGNGPATTISNLYFAVWIGFFFSFLLSSTCLAELMAERNQTTSGGDLEEGEVTPAPAPKFEELEEAQSPPPATENPPATEALEATAPAGEEP